MAGAVQRPVTEPLVLNIHLKAGARFSQDLPADFHAALYTYRGVVEIADTAVEEQRLAALNQGDEQDGLTLTATTASRALLIAGRPLHEPIAAHGPFVMNTEAEIQQAIADYQSDRLSATD